MDDRSRSRSSSTVNAVLYVRASSERQAEKGLSIPAQLRELRSYCDKHGYVILKEFKDAGFSGVTDQRPAFQEMIVYGKLHKEHLDCVLVWKHNRFSRNRVHAAVYKQYLRDLGVNVISITEPMVDSIDGELLEAVVEAVDSRFSKSLGQDVMRGIREVAKRGFYPLSLAPLGYRKDEVRDGKAKRHRLVPDEGMAPLIRRIFELYVNNGFGAKEVAKSLNGQGLTTRTGKPWSTKGVLKVLENPIYKGTLRIEFTTKNARYLPQEDRKVVLEGAFQPIVDRDTYEQAQRLRAKRARTHPRELGSEYLLSGLLRCQRCGSKMYGVAAKSSHYFYYTCKRFYESGKSECDFGFINRQRLNDVVLEKVTDVLLEEDSLRELADEVNAELGDHAQLVHRERKLIQGQLKEKETQVSRLVDAIEQGGLPVDTIRPRLQTRQEEVQRLKARLVELENEKRQSRATQLDIERIRPYVESLKETLGTAAVKTQRAILGSFIKEIGVDDNELTIEFTIPQGPWRMHKGRDQSDGVLCMVTSGTPGRT